MSSDQIMSSDSEFEADPIKNGDLFQQILDKKTQHKKTQDKKTQYLVFPWQGFSSFESINSFNNTRVARSAILNCRMNGLLKNLNV